MFFIKIARLVLASVSINGLRCVINVFMQLLCNICSMCILENEIKLRMINLRIEGSCGFGKKSVYV